MEISPLLSIVSINYNNQKGLQKTIESVIGQSYKHFEYLIIDGGSTDGSKDIIKDYTSYLHYWVSEPDAGVFNAMNKGASKANGKYLLFLNSGDVLHHSDALSHLVAQVMENPDKDIYYTDLLLADPKNNTEQLHQCPAQLTLAYFTGSFIGHPASITKTSLFHEMGGYSERYHIISDWLFFIRAFLKGHSFQYINMTLSTFFLDGISSTGNQLHQQDIQKVYLEDLNFIAADMNALKKLNSRAHKLTDFLLNTWPIEMLKRRSAK